MLKPNSTWEQERLPLWTDYFGVLMKYEPRVADAKKLFKSFIQKQSIFTDSEAK